MTIETLIDKQDTFEIVGGQIAAILAAESVSQMALATAAGKDPELWRLRVFRERTNPWAEFIDAPENGTESAAPIVHVTFDTETFDEGKSNVVERQLAVATYNVDVFGYGRSQGETVGHTPGDAKAALVAQRGMRLVRNILMAAKYTYLDMRGVVWRRFPQSITQSQPTIDRRPVPHVVGLRMAFGVQFNELSPQVQGVPLSAIYLRANRDDGTGEILFDVTLP